MKFFLPIFLTLISTAFFPGALKALDTPGPGTTYSYPLPARAGSLVNMVYHMTGSGSVRVLAYSESGNRVVDFNELKPGGLQTSQVDLCCLAPGVYLYFVSIKYDSGSQEKLGPAKFVVVR